MERKKKTYYLFEFDKNKYIFDYRNIFYSCIDDESYNFYRQYLEDDHADLEMKKHVLYEELRNLYENNIFFSNDLSLERDTEYSEAYISFAPIHTCNLNCKYCFAEQGRNYKEEDKKISKENLKRILYYLYFRYFENINNFNIELVSGGEPMLAFDMIEEMIKISREIYQKSGKKTNFWLCTNGLIYDVKKLKVIDKNNFGLGISLDGDKVANDKNRVFADGSSSYNEVVHNIKKIKLNSEFSKRLRSLRGLVVITRKTESLVDILKHHKKIGFQSVQMKFVRSNNDDVAISKEDIPAIQKLYTELYYFFLDEVKKNDITYIKLILNDNDYWGKIIRKILLRLVTNNRCRAGKNKVSFTANGDLYPCDSFVGVNEFCIGNAMTGIKSENVLCNVFCEDRKICEKCWARFVCGGDCFHNSYIHNSSVYKPDSVYCAMEKYLIELSIALVYNIRVLNVELFFEIQRLIALELNIRN